MQSRLLSACVAAVVASGFLAGSPRATAAYVLDNLNVPTPGTPYQITLLNAAPTYTSPSDIISAGVSRQITVNVTAPVNPAFNAVSGTIGSGAFSLNTDDLTKANASITYTLTGSASNLTGTTGLSLQFIALNAGNVTNTPLVVASNIPVTITVVTSGGTKSLTTSISSLNPTFNFASFTGPGTLALGNVSSIRIALNGGANSRFATDFSLDNVKVLPVPAPAGIVLGAIGFVGLLGGRARSLRRKAVAA